MLIKENIIPGKSTPNLYFFIKFYLLLLNFNIIQFFFNFI